MKVDEHLAESVLFDGLPQEQLREVAAIASVRRFFRGQTIFVEGGRAEGFYTLVSGRIKVFKLSLDGKEQILHIFGPGEVFGEVPVFAGGRYPAHAEALETVTTLFIPRDAFVDLVRREPSLALNMLGILSQRLRVFTHLIEDLSLKEVPGRLAAYLLYLSDRNGRATVFELDITKGQLASLLGTIPETLSRILTRMNQQGFIVVEGKKIALQDREAMESLAAGEKIM